MTRTKTLTLIILLFGLGGLLAGCSKENKDQAMDELATDGLYHYQNEQLGFALDLPPDFIYYQTQRRDMGEISDLEILVPTGDAEYVGTVPNYATPVVVRVFQQEFWENAIEQDKDMENVYQKVFTSDGHVVTVRFSDNMPKDWQEKWTSEMKEAIKRSIKSNN